VAGSIVLQLREHIDSMDAALAEFTIEDMKDDADETLLLLEVSISSISLTRSPYALSQTKRAYLNLTLNWHPSLALARDCPAQAPTTAATSHYEAQHSFIIALLEGRGIAREVGMAVLDRDTGRVMLIQVLLPRILCEA
jgi:hypothetical protein